MESSSSSKELSSEDEESESADMEPRQPPPVPPPMPATMDVQKEKPQLQRKISIASVAGSEAQVEAEFSKELMDKMKRSQERRSNNNGNEIEDDDKQLDRMKALRGKRISEKMQESSLIRCEGQKEEKAETDLQRTLRMREERKRRQQQQREEQLERKQEGGEKESPVPPLDDDDQPMSSHGEQQHHQQQQQQQQSSLESPSFARSPNKPLVPSTTRVKSQAKLRPQIPAGKPTLSSTDPSLARSRLRPAGQRVVTSSAGGKTSVALNEDNVLAFRRKLPEWTKKSERKSSSGLDLDELVQRLNSSPPREGLA